MLRTVEAIIDESGSVYLREPLRLDRTRRALITILDEEPAASAGANGRLQAPGTALSADDDVAVASVATAVAAVKRTWGVLQLDSRTLRWAAEDHELEYGATGAA